MASNGTATDPPSSPAPAPSSAAPAPSSPPPAQSSAAPPPASSPAPPPAQSSAAPPASSRAPSATDTTQTVTASSAPPSATQVQTSTITITPTPTKAGETPQVVVITSIITPSAAPAQPTKSGAAPAGSSPVSTDAAGLQGAKAQNSSGLSTGGKTAVAVVVPVVVVALLVLGAILFWRRRKQQKNNEDERRKEVEEYGYNPNHDPTLPAVGMQSEMAEDSSGYRGWGNTATSSGRKASTTLTSGMTYSDSNSNPGGYQSPNSPTAAGYSDVASNDPLVNGRRETLDADGIAALGAAPHAITHQQGVARGPSNASSSYSAANHSDNSGEYPGMASNPQEYYEQGYGSYQDGPYGGNTAYGAGQQPVIRDVSARRNTRIENPSVFPQGNSGVATNF